MLNWTDMTSLMIVLVAALGASAGSHSENGGIVTTILFGIVGLLAGFAVAALSAKLAYLALNSKKLNVIISLSAYMLSPVFFILATGLGLAFISALITKHVL